MTILLYSPNYCPEFNLVTGPQVAIEINIDGLKFGGLVKDLHAPVLYILYVSMKYCQILIWQQWYIDCQADKFPCQIF